MPLDFGLLLWRLSGQVLKAALPPGITAKHVASAAAGADGDRRFYGVSREDRSILQLTTDQLNALFAIQETQGFHTVLLHGVTGSGKTEVYLRAVEYYISQGKSALILVPEIGLTPPIDRTFRAALSGNDRNPAQLSHQTTAYR